MQFPCQTHEGRGWRGGRWKVAEVARSRTNPNRAPSATPIESESEKFCFMCVQRPLSTDSLSLLCACSLSLRLSGLCRLVWLFPFPFCTLSTCATVAACCSLLCACSCCRLAFLFQAKKDEAMSEIFATLSPSLSIPLSLTLCGH